MAKQNSNREAHSELSLSANAWEDVLEAIFQEAK